MLLGVLKWSDTVYSYFYLCHKKVCAIVTINLCNLNNAICMIWLNQGGVVYQERGPERQLA
jgi:hypothetical protein